MTAAATVCTTCGQQLAATRTFPGLCAACLFRLAQEAAIPPAVDAAPACRVLSVLGAGVHAVSYLAESVEERRLVVLKIFDLTIADADVVAIHAGTIVGLRHRGLATSRQLGVTAESRPFLVRDFVAGAALSSFLQRPEQSRHTRLSLVADVREAVAYLHQAGVPHGRLTSSNVVVVNGPLRPCALLVDAGAALIEAAGRGDPSLPTAAGDLDAIERLASSLARENA